MLCCRSAQRTLWSEDHGQVSVSEVSNSWNRTADACVVSLAALSTFVNTSLVVSQI